MRAKAFLLSLLACGMFVGQASALEYTVDAPNNYLFGRSTSMEEVHTEAEPVNADRSKSVALIPPGFGTPTSYLPSSGEYLTPNLVPGALSGGLVPQLGEINYPAVDAGASYTPTQPTQTVTFQPIARTAFTSVTSDLFYSGGYLGTLKIPRLGVNVKVYEGTGSAELAKGAGHFTDTSIDLGNVCIAGHNRGANCYFGDIHTLNTGDRITLTTKLGTRSYSVTSVKKIDNSDTTPTLENCITLFTCVRNQSEYRWCVRAVEV